MKFKTLKQATKAICTAYRLRLTVGKTGDISTEIARKLVDSGFLATFWGFDNENNNIGFGTELERTGEEDRAIKEFFRPELRNRIDQICKFVKLDRLAVKKIVVKFVAELQTSLQAKNIRLSMSEALIDHLADQGYDSRMGARPLSRKIDELVRVPLSRKILFDGLRDCAIRADMQDGQVVFNSVSDVTTGVNEHGIIVVGTDEN